jgi:hypothetical protein
VVPDDGLSGGWYDCYIDPTIDCSLYFWLAVLPQSSGPPYVGLCSGEYVENLGIIFKTNSL